MDTELEFVEQPAGRRLPEPSLKRWQPLRMGVVELFYYDSEEFEFVKGHLVLRGNNGTGKSKVLSLTMPLLLDAEVKTSRVEPDSDPTKKMSWNLLVNSYERRIGYTWIEFGRIDDDGEVKYLMLGAGLSAANGKPKVDSWFFLVEGGRDSQRVNRDFWLTSPEGPALTERRLRELVHGKIGTVFPTAVAYRRAVDQRLFQLGEARYSALMDTLIQLRRPHLSEKPDESKLSAALSESLPPISRELLVDVAEALGGLEDDRKDLDGFERLADGVEKFERRYRLYASTQSRRQAKLLRQSQTEFDTASRAYNRAQELLEASVAEEAVLKAAEKAAEVEESALRSAELKLLQDPAMQDVNSYDSAVKEKARAERDERDQISVHDEQLQTIRKEAAQSAAQKLRIEQALKGVHSNRQLAAQFAAQAGFGTGCEASALQALPTDELAHLADKAFEAGQQGLKKLAADRLRDVLMVRKKLDAVRDLATAVSYKQITVNDLAEAVNDALEAQTEREAAFTEEGESHLGAWEQFIGAFKELKLDRDKVLAELAMWVVPLTGDHPGSVALDAAFMQSTLELGAEQTRLNGLISAVQERLSELNRERQELEAGIDPEPAAPYTRGADARLDRAGAPLWKLLDFQEHVPEAGRAGIEAALEGAGLLDAWIDPAGQVAQGAGGAVLLDTRVMPRSPVETKLSKWLVASRPEDAGVPAELVGRLLDGIACSADDDGAETWVGLDGQFRIGALAGQWRKPKATFIGFTARAQARAARLAEIATAVGASGRELDSLDDERSELLARKEVANSERTGAPSESGLRRAALDVASAIRELNQVRTRFNAADEELRQAKDAESVERLALQKLVEDLKLSPEHGVLDQVQSACSDFTDRAYALIGDAKELRSAWPVYQNMLEREAELQEKLKQQQQRVDEAEKVAAAARAIFDAIEQRVGSKVKELQTLVAEARSKVVDSERAHKQAVTRAGESSEARAKAESGAETTAKELQTAADARTAAVLSLQRFADTGIFAAGVQDTTLFDGLPIPWTIDPALSLARKTEQMLAQVDDRDETWNKVQRQLGEDLTELQQHLSALSYTCVGELTDYGQVVTIVYQNRQERPDRLLAIVKEEVRQRQELLTAKEREVLENHLQAEIASSVQRLLKAADQHVLEINRELDKRPTSTGVKFRLVWEALSENEGAPVGLAQARQRLLNTSSELWSYEDRQVVGAMLQERIAAERARAEAGTGSNVANTLPDQLAKALDYRSWHRFRVERWQDKQWRKLSGPASSGERALGLTVPLFAAVASFYGKAKDAPAPRLMLLDEAFAGIDDIARADLMGLVHEFDLDFIITSEREWGCYAALPGVAICQLQRRPGVDAVYVSRWVWDGKAKREVGDPDRRFPPAQS
jgi:uncharacterized protein (TIGR02680 family)